MTVVIGWNFINRTQKAQTLKLKKNVLNETNKIENLCTLKDTITKMKEQGTDW